MTTAAQLRKGALDLPESELSGTAGPAAFAVRGATFASLTTDKTAVDLRLGPDAVEKLLAEHPTAEAITRDQTVIGVRIPLADVNGMVLNDLVAQAWRHCAPKQLGDAFDAAMRGDATDLPAIGRPATRALTAAGITSLDQVATRTEAELLAMHGVGPRAVRLLGEALTERGQHFAH
ncbi:hypothetical protein [Ruania alba]|uniref:Helix-hairpin-helix domain-containing protein n=1 Tax=Ruania alba TaxID=648782 RepID=A0A1H5N843_9MICO|nr:hypothetical protein [Ruania alba]SEE97047.1 hypothetical protein SAMN04488554_3984 [Ruania alba]